jgi:ankyrin repeat protein
MGLHEAAVSGDLPSAEQALRSGVDVDVVDATGSTALLLACFDETPRPDVVELLIRHGADPYRRNVHWQTPRTKAWERYLLSGFDPLSHLPAPPSPETAVGELDHRELDAVEAAVTAVVERDRAALQNLAALDEGRDPYEETYDYGRWGTVHLLKPPGDPGTWTVDVSRGPDHVWVGVEMWTREEGRSDLTLELELVQEAGTIVQCRFENLHVM